MSGFISHYTAFSGLAAAQTALDPASHTVANASTVGITRQRIKDVDITEAVMDLELQRTAYEAALAAFAQSSQTSLIDFLR